MENKHMKISAEAAIPLTIAAVLTMVCIMGIRADLQQQPEQGCQKTSAPRPGQRGVALEQRDGDCESFITRVLLAGETG
jgi:hypothetical protein